MRPKRASDIPHTITGGPSSFSWSFDGDIEPTLITVEPEQNFVIMLNIQSRFVHHFRDWRMLPVRTYRNRVILIQRVPNRTEISEVRNLTGQQYDRLLSVSDLGGFPF